MSDIPFTESAEIRKLLQKFHEIIQNNDDTRLDYANTIAEHFIQYTKKSYTKISTQYKELRTETLFDFEKKVWDILVEYIEKYVSHDSHDVKLLDVGAANGRDVLYSTALGYETYGCDIADGFISLLRQLEDEGKLRKDSIKQCDMRALDYQDSFFDVVRYHASLIHLPITSKGYMLDLAIKEAFRVLKPNGLMFALVKAGNGLQIVDTNEGLGERIIQYHSHKTINDVVCRNGFIIIQTSDETASNRVIDSEWICLIAQKENVARSSPHSITKPPI